MSSPTEIADNLRKQIESIEQKCKGLKGQKPAQRLDAIQKHQKTLNRIVNLIKVYELKIDEEGSADTAKIHKSQLTEFNNRLATVKRNLQYARGDGLAQNELFRHRGPQDGVGDLNTRDGMIMKGHQLQKEGMDALKNVLRGVHTMDAQADAINVELDRQINKLDEVYTDLNDMETTLKRAETKLKYFARSIYTDRLMMCMIALIIIAIVVIIVLSAMGKLPKAQLETIK